MSWYETAYRKLFFDFHSQETVQGLAAAFDAERWADRLTEANAQAVSIFIKCGSGWSFYRKGSIRYIHPQLPAGLDMVEAQVAALHRRGIKAVGYYNIFGSEPVARDYPDWIRRDEKDQPCGTSICMQSPLLEKWLLPHLEEVVTNYDLDGMFFDGLYAHSLCRCSSCRKRFGKEVGRELPTRSEDPNWGAYVKWTLEDYRRIRQTIAEAIHRVRPEMPVSYNWAYTMRMPEDVPPYVGNLMIDIIPADQVFNGSYQARNWAASGLPFDIMNSAFLQWWGDWSCKPATAMTHEVAPIVANGGLTWIGYQMTHAFDVTPAVMNELGKTLAFVKDREPLLAHARPKAGVAVLHSTDSHFYDVPRFFVDETGMRGVHKVCLESALPHHFVTEKWLHAHLQGVPASERYPVVILSDQRRISPDLAAALERYVQEGGGLLVTGKTGTLDSEFKPTGRFALEDLLGVKLVGEDDQSHCYIDVTDRTLSADALAQPHLIEGQGVYVQPAADVQVLADLWRIYLRGDGKVLLRWSPPGTATGHPAITFRRVGRGAAAYVAADVFRAYILKNEWSMKHILAGLIRKLAPSFPVYLAAEAWLEVALAEQKTAAGTRSIIHLVNPHGNRPVDQNNVCIEQTLPVRDAVLTIRRSTRPRNVTLEPGGINPKWHFDGRHVIVQVPEIRVHTAVVME